MRIAFIGDCVRNTGPSNVNRSFQRYLSSRMYFTRSGAKVLRMLESLGAVLVADRIVVSGMSRINDISIRAASKLGKPFYYLMHGCYSYECEVNHFAQNQTSLQDERRMLEGARRIITVSESYMQFVAQRFPKYQDKLSFVNNGIEWDDFERREPHKIQRDPFLVLSMGGGRPQKHNLVVSKAVRILNETYQRPFHYVVLGRDYEDTEALKKSPYTDYVGQVSEKEVANWLAKTFIYVQASSLESFGLAPIEALCSGCNLLMSREIGAISILSTITGEDLITDYLNPQEIAEKILRIAEHPNAKRLLSGIDQEQTSCRASADKLMGIIEK